MVYAKHYHPIGRERKRFVLGGKVNKVPMSYQMGPHFKKQAFNNLEYKNHYVFGIHWAVKCTKDSAGLEKKEKKNNIDFSWNFCEEVIENYDMNSSTKCVMVFCQHRK